MSYEDARAQLAAVLATVGITSPVVQTVARVHADPPGSVESDLPCFVLYGSSGARDWIAHGTATVSEEHTERVRLLLRDADLDRAANLVRAYRAATIAALAADPTLGGHARLSRLGWEEPSGFSYAGTQLVGLDLLLTFQPLSP